MIELKDGCPELKDGSVNLLQRNMDGIFKESGIHKPTNHYLLFLISKAEITLHCRKKEGE